MFNRLNIEFFTKQGPYASKNLPERTFRPTTRNNFSAEFGFAVILATQELT
jgi:hypothetical protein